MADLADRNKLTQSLMALMIPVADKLMVAGAQRWNLSSSCEQTVDRIRIVEVIVAVIIYNKPAIVVIILSRSVSTHGISLGEKS